MIGIYLDSDWSEIDAEMDRLSRMPDFETAKQLDMALQELFGFSQTVVHIETASLKSSGKVTSKVDKLKHRWEGEITYGGPSTGVNNPVDYAWYEQRRDEGHDFMKPVQVLAEQMLGGAMERGLG